MCGIAGVLVARPDLLSLPRFMAALDLIRHRGPDDEGYAVLDGASSRVTAYSGRETDPHIRLPALAPHHAAGALVALGHRRLSILDTSPAGHQPMGSADGRLWISFNGEIYNYVELRAELAALGHAFRTGSDTEVLLAAFAEWGTAMLPRLVGMFAFALLDLRHRRLVLARDAFGIKPLYYSWAGVGLVFASAIAPVLALGDLRARIDPAQLYTYLRFGLTDGAEGTFFAGVKQVRPGHWIELLLDQTNPGAVKSRRFWRLDLKRRIDVSFDGAVEQFRALFRDSIALHLRSDVPVGSCLSGGLDSTAIVMTMRELLGPAADLRTFSYIADDPQLSEAAYVECVREAGGVNSFSVKPRAHELLEDLDRLIRIQGEPFGTTSMYAQMRVFQLAKEGGVKVVLDGQGSDELFGGYPMAVSAQLTSLLLRGNWMEGVRLLQKSAVFGGGMRRRTLLSALGRMVPPSLAGPLMSLVGEPLFPDWLNRNWFRERGVPGAPRAQGRGSDALRRELLCSIEDVTLPQILRSEDRNSMAFSIESRVPFCVPAMAEFALSLPPNYLVKPDGDQKAVVRAAMAGTVPDIILRRPKMGFAVPEQRWLRVLSPWIDGVINSERLATIPFLHQPAVRRMMSEQLSSRYYLSEPLWRVLNVLGWMRVFGVAAD